jgi:NAD(P)-dependent dehydrogenase (short-subunit alcohol dehydrogenase family)
MADPVICANVSQMNTPRDTKETGSQLMTTTALITGGTSGIGRAVANKLAQLGVHVLVVGRNAQRGEKTIAGIRATGGQADFIASDLLDAASVRRADRGQQRRMSSCRYRCRSRRLLC